MIALVCLTLLGGELARRAVTGHGKLHTLALAAYHRYKAARLEKERAVLGLPERAEEPLTLYNDALVNDWQDWSWATHDIASTANVYKGAHAIAMTPAADKAIYLHHAPIGVAGYGTLQFSLFGTMDLKVGIVDANGTFKDRISLEKYRVASPDTPIGWNLIRVPLTVLGLSRYGDSISGIVFQATATTPPLFLDEISLQPDPTLPTAPTEATVAVTIDETADSHPISPYIYGLAFAGAGTTTDLRVTVNRWGGNDKTRYNWVHGNADNAARDWHWANRPADTDGYPPPGPSSSADAFIRQNNTEHAASLMTVPTIGWVARDADNGTMSVNVPATGGAPLTTSEGAIAGYDPTENRKHTSLPSAAHKPTPFTDSPDPHSPVIYQDEWINHLVNTFGKTSPGGVRFYAMDNEPDIWDNTHTDVHPAQMGYDSTLANFLEYANAVKAVDPSGQITGPVLSGWTSLQYSALDRGKDNFQTHADCTQHGGEAFTLWFLKQVKAHDTRIDRRTLDVLDIHYYPQGQGLYSDSVDRDSQTRRIRSTRSLWDPTYVDESWIGEPVRLIPRLKEWIAAGYPGTKLGITEWNFGGDKDISGAIAIADTLGIFGREEVYLANYWAWPQPNSPGYLAFRLYRNADDHGHGFGDISHHAVSANVDQVTCYAATDTQTGELTLMLINKMPKATVKTPITFKNRPAGESATRLWTLSAAQPKTVLSQAGPGLHNGVMTVSLPPCSITLVRLKK